jgi:hypothetical protein
VIARCRAALGATAVVPAQATLFDRDAEVTSRNLGLGAIPPADPENLPFAIRVLAEDGDNSAAQFPTDYSVA